MTTSPSTGGRRDSDDRSERLFEAIGREQCLDLLASNHLGRVAWQAADLPQILPVTYATHKGSVYFRTTPDGILSSWLSRQGSRLKWTSSTSRHGAAGASSCMDAPARSASPTPWPIFGLRTPWSHGRGEIALCSSASVPTAYPAGSYAGPRDSRGRCQRFKPNHGRYSARRNLSWEMSANGGDGDRDLSTRWIPTEIHGCPLSC